MADAGSSAMRPERASARLVERAESALPPLLRSLGGDLLLAVAAHLDDADLTCLRLTCKAFLDHSNSAQKKCRADFLRTHALAVFALDSMPGFVPASSCITGPRPPRVAWKSSLEWRLQAMLRRAARIGCVGVLAELVDNRQCELTADACEAAAWEGKLEALVWLRSRGCPWGATCQVAARGGHLEVLRYAHEHGCKWGYYTCEGAARGGRAPRGAAVRTRARLPVEAAICWSAAEEGHLEVLRYAHEHGSPWYESTCYAAAEMGQLEALRYAHEHGCPWNLDECRAKALQNGHAAVVEYLRAAQSAP
eukprot:CAMPEP_0180026178 /NCGR_PEP_ID=MMETSP0984-20121128/25047_1 /TAXON_ID=483367 /ORGANISM="non described non described, Strain CCMP 2436" /LENGTH=307 /DNA_ID=CAMNT_0021950853 /DNA_START=37 /DNA_END=961 /DNA_ORIENTATION=+